MILIYGLTRFVGMAIAVAMFLILSGAKRRIGRYYWTE